MKRGPPAPRVPRVVLLDLDGTLVDSAPDLALAANAALAAVGHSPVSECDVRRRVGNGARVLVARCLAGADDARPAPGSVLDRAMEVFLDHYARHVCVGSVVYPGVREGLRALRALDLRLACVTNKPGAHAEALLRALDLREPFDLVLGGDAVTRGKPDPEPVRTALARLEAAPDEAIMVGDSRNDVLAARAAGVAVVCVSYGYNHGGDIRDARPDAVIDSLEALPRLLRPADR